ncbi:serine/threonine-protein kinase [Okeania sp. SIO1I7]|uniref:serine/threonine-protein kinase n=1 Tax=Okeania sp. SIO1I7 TaxID=2607772 RepID=UPI0013F9ED25|nr:serine/threonine-protein kinase [Okeania sp. SIO1I7]NET26753.1 protein kinase [Okeania sp. SIO1I7]
MAEKILKNRYKIISELGKGGFGNTYLAVDLDLPNHSQCVVKQLAPSDARPQVFQVAKILFEKEAKTLQRLGENNQIPTLFAYFEEGGQFYLVQELIEGDDLTKEIYSGKKIGENKIVQLFIEILEVLKYVHQQNVIHRDLKPQNIMRRKSDGKIVLIDFGAVKEINELTVTSTGHTTATVAVGTLGYMPSEQAAGKPKFCSDIYAVGIMGIEALTGIPVSNLREDNSTGEIIWKNQVNVSETLVRVIDKMVSDYWKDRYQNVEQAIGELSNIGNNDVNYPLQYSTSQKETVLIQNNQSTIPVTSALPSLMPEPLPTPNKTWVKIGLGIALGAIFTSTIVYNIPKKPDIHLQLSSTASPSPLAEFKTITGHSEGICPDDCIAISSDGQTIVSGSKDRTIKVWDLTTGSLKVILTDSDSVDSVAISPEGKTVISGDYDNSIKVWDVATGTLKATFTGHTDPVVSVAFSPDGKTVISASLDKTIKVWDLATGTLKATLTGHDARILSLAISPDGKTIVSGSDDKTIKVWDLATGAIKGTFTGHSARILSVAISSNGKRVVSGSSDKTIKIWDLATGTLIATLIGHKDDVNSVTFTPDGQTIVSASDDRTIKIWDFKTETLKATLTGHSDDVYSVAISPDGKTIVSGSDDKTIKIWEMP